VACAAAPSSPPAPKPDVVSIARASASAPLAEPPKPEPPPEPLAPLGWTNTEGGGAGFLPVGGSQSFMGVDSVDGIRETLAHHRRVAFTLTPNRLCALAGALEPARARVSIDLDIMSPITLETEKCLERLHPPAVSFTMLSGPDAKTSSPAVMSILSHLDDCEALGIAYPDDDVARLLGDRAETPDGASLRSLALVHGRLSADAFAAIAKRRKLRALGFRGTNAVGPKGSPTGIAALAVLPDLERLDLSYGNVTDDDLAAFGACKRLSWLMLESTKIDGHGVTALARSRGLTYVNLNATDVDDAAVEALANLPSVTYLGLYRTRVTDKGIAHLARMTSLEELTLEMTHVTSASFEVFAKLPKLRSVSLPGTIPRAEVEAFRAAHPKLDVRHWN
jgi:hypothetical protein